MYIYVIFSLKHVQKYVLAFHKKARIPVLHAIFSTLALAHSHKSIFKCSNLSHLMLVLECLAELAKPRAGLQT